MELRRDYLLEELLYEQTHRDGKPYYRQEADWPCAPEFASLFAWDSFPKRGSSILELGCGDGFHTSFLVKMGLAVTGVDCSLTAIRFAKENLKHAEPPVTLLVGDVCRLGLPPDSFDSILDSHCLHCVTDYPLRLAFLSECRRVLKPQGRLFLATMAAQAMEWANDIEPGPQDRRYEIDERGCYFESRSAPGRIERTKFRLLVTEAILRDEIRRSGLEIVRFETFAPPKAPGDLSFLVELSK